jgi:hypothetical protein
MRGGNGVAVVLEVLLYSLLCFGYSGMYIADTPASLNDLSQGWHVQYPREQSLKLLIFFLTINK